MARFNFKTKRRTKIICIALAVLVFAGTFGAVALIALLGSAVVFKKKD